MSTDVDGAAPLSELENLAAEFTAARTFAIYSQAVMFFVMAHRGAIDPEQVFALNRTLASGFRQTAAGGKSVPVPARSLARTADMLDELEAVIRNMVTIPAGAGHA
jgi:hypothetical protein